MSRLLLIAAAGTTIAALSIAAAPAPGITTLSGTYTTAQAAEGKDLYAGACATCHGPNLHGSFEAPTLTGKFIANWSGSSVGELHSYVQHAMPLFAPGSLTPEDNAKIVAYMLQANGYPAGTKPLPSDAAALNKIAFAPLTPALLAGASK